MAASRLRNDGLDEQAGNGGMASSTGLGKGGMVGGTIPAPVVSPGITGEGLVSPTSEGVQWGWNFGVDGQH